jgi:hypothetical protein
MSMVPRLLRQGALPTPAQAPFVRLTLSGHVPAPARVEIVRVPLLRRGALTLASALGFWGLAVVLIVLPPHYPYFLGALAFGVYFPYRFWTGKYRVRAFAGICPRCGGHLQLAPGTRIDLPLTVTCFACHFEPVLEISPAAPEAAAGGVRHRGPECVGAWKRIWLADERFVVCDRCRTHFPYTPEAWGAAEAENARGSLLERLTDEGKFLT